MPLSPNLFDLDHTLFDFEASKRAALAAALGEAGITDWEPLLPILSAVERPLWHALENGTTTLDTLNDNRFAGLVTEANLDVDPVPLAASYLAWLGRSGGLLDGARELLESLAETHIGDAVQRLLVGPTGSPGQLRPRSLLHHGRHLR
ncbi:MAG: hypothetical protein R2706_06595 [Acidimicrobiales bacterium]